MKLDEQVPWIFGERKRGKRVSFLGQMKGNGMVYEQIC